MDNISMKKTLIALAVATFGVVSGSATAWTEKGTGNPVELGGTLTRVIAESPWEVKTGDAVTDLNAYIKNGEKTAIVRVTRPIPVLGIRTRTLDVFQAKSGITPQIDYKNAVNVEKFSLGETTLEIDVRDDTGKKIGRLVSPFSAAAMITIKNNDTGRVSWDSGYAGTRGKAFFGGVGKYVSGAVKADGVEALIRGISSEFLDRLNMHGVRSPHTSERFEYDFSYAKYTYSAAYGSGIRAGSDIIITLDSPSGKNEIKWKASVPVEVSYM
ncbi:hypothetical protein F1H45_22070 [Salmonella enterica]|nr:hypothetical protein [Salmonella enterica]